MYFWYVSYLGPSGLVQCKDPGGKMVRLTFAKYSFHETEHFITTISLNPIKCYKLVVSLSYSLRGNM